jgi:uncharacterized protein
MKEYEVRTVHTDELRAIEGDEPVVSGRAIVYDSWSEDMGGWREIINPGAVELEDDLRVLFDHDTSMVIGRTKAGTAHANDDGMGVVMRATPPNTTWAKDMLESMRRGDIDQMSFRMLVLDDDYTYDSQADIVRRTINRALVSELSVVSMPAYAETAATTRSRIQEVREAEIPVPEADAAEDTEIEGKADAAKPDLHDVGFRK